MIATCVVIYLMVQPVLNSKFGLGLPGLFGGSSSQPAIASTDTGDVGSGSARTSPSTERQSSATDRANADQANSGEVIGDLVLKPKAQSRSSRAQVVDSSNANSSDEMRPDSLAVAETVTEAPRQQSSTKTTPKSNGQKPAATKSSKEDPQDETAQAPLGKLTQVGPKIFETTAGLRYGPGSVDGHRLLHIMQHAKDRPDKPVHGVFDGDEYKIRAMIDEAYLIADLRGPPQAKKEVEQNRTIWKVDMKRKVGYLGGETGKRKGHPPLTGIQIVLEGVNVITAFPIDPRR